MDNMVNHSMRLCLIQKPNKDIPIKEKYRPTSFNNTDIKTLNGNNKITK
jgi:hypothetical protein